MDKMTFSKFEELIGRLGTLSMLVAFDERDNSPQSDRDRHKEDLDAVRRILINWAKDRATL